MRSPLSLRKLALAGAGAAVIGSLALPAVASATPAPEGIGVDHGGISQDYWHHGWYHPEWGPGWNNGYPAPGWVPPAGWMPPPDWIPPNGWYPPAGWAPPPTWVGPCAGPLFNFFHPLRCA
ncbi:MAG TPA: hypothetical protein VHA37_07420 [Candidatus Saccharimonadales bacterium]|jgi:hypothetical protein|nr:hypothetical protein [Candidatus Saccharimonadales bacterium]